MYHQIIVIITININILLRYITTLNISLGTNTYFFFFNQYTSIRDYIWTVDLHFRIGELRYTTDTFFIERRKRKKNIVVSHVSSVSINFSSVSSPSSFLFPFTPCFGCTISPGFSDQSSCKKEQQLPMTGSIRFLFGFDFYFGRKYLQWVLFD